MDVLANNIVTETQIDQNMQCNSRLPEADGEINEVKQNEQEDVAENFNFPRFVIRPANTCILINETGTIETHISGLPKPIVRWYKNGHLITSSMFPRMKKHHSENETYVLEIQKAEASDAGSYNCIARNCYGSITSSEISVKIVDLDLEYPRFLKRLKRTDLSTGKNGRLEVKVIGSPKPEVTWLRNSIPLNGKRIECRYHDPHTYVLHIKDIESRDSGLYTCQACNNAGIRSTSAMINVEGNKNINRSITQLSNDSLRDKEWAEDLNRIRRQSEIRQWANGWSQREMDDYLYRINVANYHIKYRPQSSEYCNLF